MDAGETALETAPQPEPSAHPDVPSSLVNRVSFVLPIAFGASDGGVGS